MKKPRVAVFCMESTSHFNRLRPLISGLAQRRLVPYVFTHRRFQAAVERVGGIFVDLFARHTVDEADSESIPFSCRSVSFAGLFAEEVALDAQRIRPSLIVYDAFAVIGYAVAVALGLPYVTVCAGHNLSPSNADEVLRTIPRRVISSRCTEAVRRLRDRYKLRDASPLSYAATSSPFLNVYCEPPEFLTAAERQTFEPVAFFGSVQPGEREPESAGAPLSAFGKASPNELKVYVSFGTVVWKHFAAEALAAMRTIAKAVATIEDVRAVISLGGRLDADRVAVRQPNVAIAHYVDQWRILQAADLFVTHHGLNSTHEAIFHGVPMVSYPFLGDQPGLAKRCQDLGLAIPLTGALRGKVDQQDVGRAFALFRDRREAFRKHLAAAQEWEMKVIEGRGAVLDRLTALIGTQGGG